MNTRLTIAAALATVLASIALYPLLSGGSWFWGGIGAVAVVAGVGALTRRRAIPAIVCFLAAVAGEFEYLNVTFAGHQSWAGLVPTGASVHHLRLLVSQGTMESVKAGPPVPARPGIMLLTVAGIGLVAALTDVLAVRLHRPAIAGLPLLLMFCVPLTTDAQAGAVGSTLVFCAAVVGYLGLLSADGRHRLRLWGRLVQPWHDDAGTESPDVRPLAAAGRRIGTAAVVLALFLPLLVPGLKQHRLFSGSGNGGNKGYHGQISFPKPLAALNQQLREGRPQNVLTYTSNESLPPYLQVYVLTHLTTQEWTMTQPVDAGVIKKGHMPAAPGLTARVPFFPLRERISLGARLGSGSNVSYLPLPYPASLIHAGGTWRADPATLTALADDARLAGLRYNVYAKDLNPSPDQLRKSGPVPPAVTADEYVPPAYRELLSLARHLTRHRITSYSKAVALQNWFTKPGNFRYTLQVPSTSGPGALQQFLTKTKAGYCQQFAFGMAVLARLVHIPARVVIGYTQGTFVSGHTWLVRTSDAHAWPELYFTGLGWLRFEPTPPNAGGLPGQATALSPPYSNPQENPLGVTNPATGQQVQTNPSAISTTPRNSKVPNGKLIGPQHAGGAGPLGAHAKRAAFPFLPLAIALLAVLLIAPGATRLGSRRWRWWHAHDDVTRAHAAWRELRDDLTDYRIPYRVSESPRALAGRLARSLSLTGADRAALDRVAGAEERASYAPSPAGSAQLRSDTALVRRAIARACGPRARLAAWVMPASALVPARAALQHVLDVFGWVELATTKARDRAVLRREKPAET